MSCILSSAPNIYRVRDSIYDLPIFCTASLMDFCLQHTCTCTIHSFPREWIKGDGYPEGIGRNEELSERDKEHVKRLYGPSRLSGVPSTGRSGRGGRVTTVAPIAPERRKPVTSLPPPAGNTIHDVQVYEPHRGERMCTVCNCGY